MGQLKLILEAIVALPKLIKELRDALNMIQNLRLERELNQYKEELSQLATQLIGAQSNEERRDLVRRLNSLKL